MNDTTPPPEARAVWAAHVRLIREMGDDDDPGNVRSCAIIRRVKGSGDMGGAAPDDPWIPRALAILNEERVSRGLPALPAGGAS